MNERIGVEVDVFLLDGVLRVGQDAKSARRRKPFESVYLSLIAAGVDLIGTKTLLDSRRSLMALAH